MAQAAEDCGGSGHLDLYRIHHYPASLIDIWTLRDGRRLTLRPVLPQDESALSYMFSHLSRTSRNSRFHAAVNAISGDTIARMAQVDYRRHLALIITCLDAREERIVADARYVTDERGVAAEFALVVDDAWQGRGLGARALHALGEAARRHGVEWLHGGVLASNVAMLALLRRAGYVCTDDRHEAGLVRVERRVGLPGPAAPGAGEPAWRARWFAPRRLPAPGRAA
jgi:RimJ/RimL family protein N-acetyltransferase